jgi:hypothetical protein
LFGQGAFVKSLRVRQHESVRELLGNPVWRDGIVEDRLVERVVHQVGILAGVAEELADELQREVALGAEEELHGVTRLADVEDDPTPALAAEFADDLGAHLAADAQPAEVGVGSEVEHLELVRVDIVDRESDDAAAGLGAGGLPFSGRPPFA